MQKQITSGNKAQCNLDLDTSYNKQFTKSGEAFVLYERQDRLGARLEGMLSAWRLARETNRKLIVFWPDRNPPGSYNPVLFFDFKGMAEKGGTDDISILCSAYNDDFSHGDVLDLRKAWGWPFFLKKSDCVRNRDKAIKIVTHHSTYYCFRWQSPWRVARELKELFHRMIPNEEIRNALSAALEWIGEPDFIAVHIRRGDVVSMIKKQLKEFILSDSSKRDSPEAIANLLGKEKIARRIHHFVKRVTSIDAYIATLPKDTESRIVVFSDSPEAATDFQSKLPIGKSVLMSSFHADINETQRAYLELLILSKAARVITTASCFSRLACQIGRPSFHDARNTLGAAGTRAAFDELFGGLLSKSELLKKECIRVLNRELAKERLVRVPDWLVARCPWLMWISLK